MKNIEKYEEELRPFGVCFAMTTSGKIRSCKEFRCGSCAFNSVLDSDCYVARLERLMKEYKKPILTDEEKAYLKNVVEPKKDDVLCIRKWCFYEGTEQEYATVTIYAKHPTSTSDNSYWTLLDFVVTEDMPFEGMELQKEYTSEELGL